MTADSVRYVRYDRTDQRLFLEAAEAFRENRTDPGPRRMRSTFSRYAVLAAVLLGVAIPSVGLSDLRYPTPSMDHAELVISFKHAGQLVEQSGVSNNEDLLPHMRGAQSGRKVRAPVRMAVLVDGRQILNNVYEPSGLFNDGASIAIEPVAVPPGEHRIRVLIGDTGEAGEWSYQSESTLDFVAGRRLVVQFEHPRGFSWG